MRGGDSKKGDVQRGDEATRRRGQDRREGNEGRKKREQLEEEKTKQKK